MADCDEQDTLADKLAKTLYWYAGKLPDADERVIGDLVYLYARSATFCRLFDELLSTDLSEDSRRKLGQRLWGLSVEVESMGGTCDDISTTFGRVIEKGYKEP